MPELDNYHGSSKTLSEAIAVHDMALFEKIIINEWPSRNKANAHEAWLHGWYNAANNKLFYNKINAKDNSYDSINLARIAGATQHLPKEERIARIKKGQELAKRNGVSWGGSTKKEGNGFYKKHHQAHAKKKMGDANSMHQAGEGNSQYGTMWITNGVTNKKIKKTDTVPKDFRKGRVLNKGST